MSSSAEYSVNWIAGFLHEFPHVNFSFHLTNSTFDPDNASYRESIVFLAALPVVWCILVLLLLSICLCVHCCKEKPKKKKGTTCLRLITSVFIIFSIGGLAVGFFGNEEGNKGVQSTVDALQDTNDTLSNSVKTLSTLDSLAASITQKGLSALRAVFQQRLVNVTLRNEVLALADQIQNKSTQVRGDISGIKHKVEKASLDKVIDVTQDAEFYRWLGTIILFCWQIVVLLIYIVGTLKKSKCWLVWGLVCGYISLFLLWVAGGIYLGGDVTMSDFCVDPDTYVSAHLESRVPADVVKSYIDCKSSTDPTSFKKQYDDAQSAIVDANNTLTLAANKTDMIAKYINAPVKYIREELQYASTNLSLLSNVIYCGPVHGNYVKALHGVCNRAMVGVALILLVLPVMGLSLIFVQCLAPRIWLLLGKKKGYRVVDDSDPFLPRPPPYNGYNGYGAMSREERASVHDPGFLDDASTTVMSDAPRPASMADDSPPPAYYPGSFVAQYNSLETFPRTHRNT